jgi:hypothetical protein
MMKIRFILMALFFCLPLFAQAPPEGGPSLQETNKWIIDNLFKHSGGKWNIPNAALTPAEEEIKDVRIDNCVMTYSLDYSFYMFDPDTKKMEPTTWRFVGTIPLGALTSINLGQGVDFPQISVSTKTQAITRTETPVRGTEGAERTFSVAEWTFRFAQPDQDKVDMANRMIKALTHVRDLCKSSYNPHASEPF